MDDFAARLTSEISVRYRYGKLSETWFRSGLICYNNGKLKFWEIYYGWKE